MSETGARREQLAQLAVVSRASEAATVAAVYREPMTVDDYLEARMISDPLCMFDCDVPVDGAVAVVVSGAAAAAVDRTRAIRIESMGTASWIDASAAMLRTSTELAPSPVYMAAIY